MLFAGSLSWPVTQDIDQHHRSNLSLTLEDKDVVEAVLVAAQLAEVIKLHLPLEMIGLDIYSIILNDVRSLIGGFVMGLVIHLIANIADDVGNDLLGSLRQAALLYWGRSKHFAAKEIITFFAGMSQQS